MEPWIFLPAAAIVVAFGAIFTDTAQSLFNSLQSSIVETFGWFYILLVASVGLLRALQRETAASGVPDATDLGPQD